MRLGCYEHIYAHRCVDGSIRRSVYSPLTILMKKPCGIKAVKIDYHLTPRENKRHGNYIK
jgi:hypothetical protein